MRQRVIFDWKWTWGRKSKQDAGWNINGTTESDQNTVGVTKNNLVLLGLQKDLKR